jgi:hypothetical protein
VKDLLAAWQGRERLWKVFWLYNLLLGLGFSILTDYVVTLGIIPSLIAMVIMLAWATWITVALWRCAFNATWHAWGYIVRAIVVVSVAAAVMSLVALLATEG